MNLWTSDFGDAYTRRNQVRTVNARSLLWRKIIPDDCRSILEVGANTGQNLEAIAEFSDAELFACEPNEMARSILEGSGVVAPSNISSDFAHELKFPNQAFDLVFTSGVLIHIPAEKLTASMEEMHRVARRWIVCAEYFAPREEMIPYRGHNDALWRRDYGSLWMDAFPDLRCITVFFAWHRMTGLDNLTFWVFEKGAKVN